MILKKFDYYSHQVDALHVEALSAVLKHYGGKDAFATKFGVTEGSIRACIKAGVISRFLAKQVASDPDSPFTLPDLRADHERLACLPLTDKPGPKTGRYSGWGEKRSKV
jgi:hypothetical protein